MKSRLKSLAGLVSAVLALSTGTVTAQTLVQNGPAVGFSSIYFSGQSFLTPDDGTADLMTGFTWLNLSSAPFGSGSLYLFDQIYLGTPENITSGPGLMATSSTYSAGSYSFGSGVAISPNTYYWVYTSTTQQVGLTTGNAYADGQHYLASAGVNFAVQNANNDAAFSVTASAIPEPSTYAMMAGLGALGLAVWRRRSRASLGLGKV